MRLIAATLSVFLIALLGACDMSHTRCEDTELRRVHSPEGKYTAVIYSRSCANNTAQYTWVNLIEASENLRSKPETHPVLSLKGLYDMTATWTDSKTVEITCKCLADQKVVLTQENEWKTVRIRYAAK